MNIGEKILKYRKEMGMSQEELAEHLHVVRQTVSKWEKGTQMMGVDKYIRLSALYGVTVDYLLGITEKRK